MSIPASRPTGRSEACGKRGREMKQENVFQCLSSSERSREKNTNTSITEAFLSDDKTRTSDRSMHIVGKREIVRCDARMRKRKKIETLVRGALCFKVKITYFSLNLLRIAFHFDESRRRETESEVNANSAVSYYATSFPLTLSIGKAIFRRK